MQCGHLPDELTAELDRVTVRLTELALVELPAVLRVLLAAAKSYPSRRSHCLKLFTSNLNFVWQKYVFKTFYND
jgi:hypothetical protein